MALLWNDYISSHPFTPSLIGQGDGVYILRVWEDQPPPPELGVATGEWLYNVRSALDYVIWARVLSACPLPARQGTGAGSGADASKTVSNRPIRCLERRTV